MPKIFVAPTGDADDRNAVERSITNAVDRKVVIQNFSDATYPELIDIERRGKGFYAWGLRPGPENIQKWFHMGVGDFVLLTARGGYRHYGKVLGRYENARAAEAIWGKNGGDDEVREFMFFLSEPIALNLNCDELADYLPAKFDDFEQIDAEALDRIEADFGSVERFIRRRLLHTGAGGPMLDMSGIIRVGEQEQTRLRAFEPTSSKAARTDVVQTIIKRRGRPDFRLSLMNAYDRQCAITGCNAPDALEAAYIVPYRGRFTHRASNGILLRADLHTLFDLGKIAIDTRTMTVVISDELADTSYRLLADRPVRYPREEHDRPSTEALDLHRRLAGL